MRACFNLARNRLVQHEHSQSPGALIADRISSAPGSLTRRPLLSLAEKLVWNKVKPLYTRAPELLSDTEKQEFFDEIQKKSASEGGLLYGIEHVELNATDGIAIYDLERGMIQINTNHPFVAAFQELFNKPATSLPLEMYAISEILTEANLYHMSIDENTIRDILSRRDELLRQLVKSSTQRTPGMIALALIDAKDDSNKLEIEMRAAFEAIGFANVIRLGGSGKPDGTAEAILAASDEGQIRRYKVGLEAKSGKSVSAKRLGVSGIARHMKVYKCDHHVVIGNGFATSDSEDSATVDEIRDLRKRTGKTITLMHIDDLSRLVRLVPPKQIGLDRLRQLFQDCITPEDTKVWIDRIEKEIPDRLPYKDILETIWDRADQRPDEPVEYAAVVTALEFRTPPIKMGKQELIDCCKAMQVMARGVVFARANDVEINRRPDLILEDIHASIDEYYPDDERKTIKDINQHSDIKPIHPFPARMAPSIVWDNLPKNGKSLRVLDPMAGSGTTLVHTRALGHRAIGCDTDPLALLIARAWSLNIDAESLESHGKKVLEKARRSAKEIDPKSAYPKFVDDETRKFLEFWFDDTSRIQLTALSSNILNISDPIERTLLWCAFSRLIITKKMGVSLAMDVSHSRPHKKYNKAPIQPFDHFLNSIEYLVKKSPFTIDDTKLPPVIIQRGDARNLPIESASVDMIITSPPYLNAIDYIRGHKFTLVWKGHSISSLRSLRSDNIGSERSLEMEPSKRIVETFERMGDMRKLERRYQSIVIRYIKDMNCVLSECKRVMKKDAQAVFVIGDSTLQGVFIKNQRASYI